MISGCKKVLILIFLPLITYSQKLEFSRDESGITAVHIYGLGSEDSLNLIRMGGTQPVSGRWELEYDGIHFTPSYSLPFGSAFILTTDNGARFEFTTPPLLNSREPRILAIHPLSDTIPMNLLKVQIVFDRPMLAGKSNLYLKWRDQQTNEIIPDVFLDLKPELWNPSYDTLTLWLDPGRIKRDLIPNQEKGNPLKERVQYSLEIEPGWSSATGVDLKEGKIKEYYTVSADRRKPDPSDWQIITPNPGSTDPLKLRFNEPMDLYSVLSCIRFRNEGGEPVEGNFHLVDHGKCVEFQPVNNWITGKYDIVIDLKLEDLAGNRMGRLFDEERASSQEDKDESRVLPFMIE